MRKSAEAATAECLETASGALPARPGRFRARARTVFSYLAALAIESGSEWITTDRDYSRFPGLKWRHPLDS